MAPLPVLFGMLFGIWAATASSKGMTSGTQFISTSEMITHSEVRADIPETASLPTMAPKETPENGTTSLSTTAPTETSENRTTSLTTTAPTGTPETGTTTLSTMAPTTETPGTSITTLSTVAPTETPKTVTTTLSASTPGTRPATSPVETQTVTSLQPGATSVPKSPQNAGQVVVVCLFSSVLLVALVLVSVKYCHRREPVFRKLEEVPMENLTEESPFARYPPN
ncbi:integumentary mucin A.1-like [Tachyglossus aculeatus]|uniref:integumentary mucin A.1-like n=1 Tax=Tachyglossus aculeatus TaxID=9261 RepID=UPI0018F6F300|nr:integumentary mucin A.1-like [Tachyglossus aculeatus]